MSPLWRVKAWKGSQSFDLFQAFPIFSFIQTCLNEGKTVSKQLKLNKMKQSFKQNLADTVWKKKKKEKRKKRFLYLVSWRCCSSADGNWNPEQKCSYLWTTLMDLFAAAALRVHTPPATMYLSQTSPSYFQNSTWDLRISTCCFRFPPHCIRTK